MKLFEELKWRGLIDNVTSPEVEDAINNEKLTFYIGTDPTADSLHIGHYSSLLMAKRLQMHGHHPIMLVGGATGFIGDPKATGERNMLTPEAEAIYSTSDKVILIETENDIPNNIHTPIFVTNQTTMSVLEINTLFQAIRKVYPNAQIHDEICNATRVRQQAILDLKDSDVDTLIVVGDPTSNNTQKLAAIGKTAGIQTVLQVQDLQQLDTTSLKESKHIAITSGASTPTYLMEQIYSYLCQYPCQKEDIDLHKILD